MSPAPDNAKLIFSGAKMKQIVEPCTRVAFFSVLVRMVTNQGTIFVQF